MLFSISIFSNERIDKIYFKNLPENFNPYVYLEIQVGDLFNDYLIQKSIENLYFSGLFEKIEAYKDKINEENHLILKLKPYPRIKKIKLNCKECSKLNEYLKNYPLTDDLKIKLEGIIKEDLKGKGFFDPEIYFDFNEGNLNIKVNAGTRRKIKGILYTSEQDIKILELLKLRGKYYESFKILKFLKKIENKYKRDYPLIKINLKDFDIVGDGVVVKFEVKGGDKIKFFFDKKINKKDKNNILKKIKNESSEKDTIPVLLEEYNSELINQGYKDAKFYFESEKDNDFEILKIDLIKGQKYFLKDIKFNEGLSFSREEILNNCNIKIGKTIKVNEVNDFLENIKYFYSERGYWDVNIKFKELLDKNNIILNINIFEGNFVLVENVEILNFPQDLQKVSLNLKAGEPLKKSNVEKDLQNLQKILNDAGYYYAKVSFKIEENKFYYIIEAGEKFFVKKIIFRGLNNIYLDYLKDELNIDQRMPLSFNNLIELQAKLFSTSLFYFININPQQNYDEDNSANLHTELKEAPPMTYSYGIGYDSYDRFRLQLNFTNINFLKKRFILSFESRLFSNQQMWRVSLKDPTFLYSKYPLFLGTYRSIEKRPSFSLKRWGSLVELTRNFGKKSQTTLRYEYQIQIPFDVEKNFPIPKEEQEKKVSSIALVYLNDQRDEIFFPREGSFFSGEIKYSFPLFFADTKFLKTVFQFSYNKSPFKKTTYAFSTRVGFIKNYKKEEIPIGERLFLGGRNTLRAFSRDNVGIENDTVINGIPLGGKMSFLLNLEGRQFLSKSFGFNIFTDFGQVFSSYKKFNFDDLVGGYGFGFFFLTPIGPLRIEVSKKYESVFWDDDFQWYFSFGFPF